jgi:hypothetical protein
MKNNNGVGARIMVILGAALVTALVVSYIQSSGDAAAQQGQTDYSGIVIIPLSIIVFGLSFMVLMVIQMMLSGRKNKK